MRGVVGLAMGVALVVCGGAGAQAIDATRTGKPVNLSTATWRFAVGDDPRWADPAFDDSQWKPITLAKTFKEQGYPVPGGFFWLRLHVRLTPGATEQAIALNQGSYQVFVNGRPVGQQGGLPDHPSLHNNIEQVFSIPAVDLGEEPAAIAIREWFSPVPGVNEMSDPGVQIGDQGVLEVDRRSNLDVALFARSADNLVSIVSLIIGLWALAHFRAQPEHREYLWLGAMGLLSEALRLVQIVAAVSPVSLWAVFGAVNFLGGVYMAAFVLFICYFLHVRVDWAIRSYCASFLLVALLNVERLRGWIPPVFSVLGFTISGISIAIFAPLLAFRQYRKGDREAGTLLMALTFLGSMAFAEVVVILLNLLHLRSSADALIPDLHLGPISFAPETLSWLFFNLAIGEIMLRRSISIAEQQQRTGAELEAARSVQTFLLGCDAPAPGYSVDSAYLPAQAVGGDFFQTIAGCDGSLLAVIGDVAGKGLQAAMRVSMLIGAVRLSPQDSPAQLLAKLNGVLLQDGRSGFTTCLAARFRADGTVTIANAGHLSPYINGRELEVDGGLPLGVTAEIDYSERGFPFVAGDRMLLLSDGVVEARNARGELFGFERMADSAAGVTGAGALAETARAFGQEDDITVLLLQRASAPASTAA
jgi:phosphoserine phosphatase RsbU/P